jgi:hypothetical protein
MMDYSLEECRPHRLIKLIYYFTQLKPLHSGIPRVGIPSLLYLSTYPNFTDGGFFC